MNEDISNNCAFNLFPLFLMDILFLYKKEPLTHKKWKDFFKKDWANNQILRLLAKCRFDVGARLGIDKFLCSFLVTEWNPWLGRHKTDEIVAEKSK